KLIQLMNKFALDANIIKSLSNVFSNYQAFYTKLMLLTTQVNNFRQKPLAALQTTNPAQESRAGESQIFVYDEKTGKKRAYFNAQNGHAPLIVSDAAWDRAMAKYKAHGTVSTSTRGDQTIYSFKGSQEKEYFLNLLMAEAMKDIEEQRKDREAAAEAEKVKVRVKPNAAGANSDEKEENEALDDPAATGGAVQIKDM